MDFDTVQKRHVRRTSGKMITRCDAIHSEGVWEVIEVKETMENQGWRFFKPTWKDRQMSTWDPKEGSIWQAESSVYNFRLEKTRLGRGRMHLGSAWEDAGHGLNCGFRNGSRMGLNHLPSLGHRYRTHRKLVTVGGLSLHSPFSSTDAALCHLQKSDVHLVLCFGEDLFFTYPLSPG